MGILINLEKIYEEKELLPVCEKFKKLLEESIKYTICRHCEESACVKACPQEALKRIGENLVRSSFLCTGCKTCVIACPFGVNVDEIIEYKMPRRLNEEEIKQLRECPYVEVGEFTESENIIKLEENIFVKAVSWKTQLGKK